MKIFLSHSSKDNDVAQRIALALGEGDHDVFFDARSLAPAEGYDERIRNEIQSCDLFVFLVSAASLREGSYARSELEIAAQHFPHPSGRLLPVMLGGASVAELPPFLASVTVLDPVGNVVAETANAVETIARRRRGRRWRAGIGALVLLLAGGAVWLWLHKPSASWEPAIQITEPKLSRVRRDLGLRVDVYAVHATLANRSSTPQTVLRVDVECSPSDVIASYDDDSNGVLGALKDIVIAPRAAKTIELEVTFARGEKADDLRGLYETELAGLRWRLNLSINGAAPVATSWIDLGAEGAFENGALQPLGAPTRARIRFVAQSDQAPRDSIALAAVDPPELWDMDAKGELRRVAPLSSEPTALGVAQGCVAIATAGRLQLYVGPTEEPRGPYELDTVRVTSDDVDRRTFSVTPRSLAVRRLESAAPTPREGGSAGAHVVELEVWARSQDEDHPPFLSRFDLERETFTAPFAAGSEEVRSEVSSLCNGLNLRVIGEDVFGVTSDTSPGSVTEMVDGDFLTVEGHDTLLVSCANEIAPAPGGGMLLLDCDRYLVRAERREGTIEKKQSLGRLLLPEGAMQTWEAQRISVCGERVLVAITLFAQQPRYEAVVARLFTWTPARGVRSLAAVERCEIVAIATLADSGCAVLRTADGTYQAVRVDYEGE